MLFVLWSYAAYWLLCAVALLSRVVCCLLIAGCSCPVAACYVLFVGCARCFLRVVCCVLSVI